MKKTEYLYPEDVIVEVVNGKRVARIGYDVHIPVDQKTIVFASELDVAFDPEDLNELQSLYHKLWLKAREKYRAEQVNIFLERYHPNVLKEKQSWYDYYEKYKNDPKCGIGHWRSLQNS